MVSHLEAGGDPLVGSAATIALVFSLQAIIIASGTIVYVGPGLESPRWFIDVSSHSQIESTCIDLLDSRLCEVTGCMRYGHYRLQRSNGKQCFSTPSQPHPHAIIQGWHNSVFMRDVSYMAYQHHRLAGLQTGRLQFTAFIRIFPI